MPFPELLIQLFIPMLQTIKDSAVLGNVHKYGSSLNLDFPEKSHYAI